MKAYGLPVDEFNIDDYKGMEPIEMMLAMRRDLEFKMPARGLTRHTAILGGARWVRLTWRCEVPGCWYVCTPSGEKNLADIQAYHKGEGEDRCPTAPRRESLSSGYREIEKLWLELDDAMDALKRGEVYRNLDKTQINGYMKGLAFSIVMKEKDFFPDIKSVAIEAVKRWKRRNGKLPWEATPSSQTHKLKWFADGGWKMEEKLAEPAPTPAKKAAPRKAVKAPPVARPTFTPTADQLAAIKAGLSSGMFDASDFAGMYGTTAEEIQRVAG